MNNNSYKNVLVTGAAQRMGRAIAIDLARTGWAVAVHYNKSENAAENVVEKICTAGGHAIAVSANLALEDEASTLVERSAEGIGPITCVINNASIFEQDIPSTVTKTTWDKHMQINLWAPFLLAQAFAEQLPLSNKGNIINIIDQRVWNLTPDFISYTLSKSGLWTLTQTLAMAFAPNIRVNAIGPGPTLQNTYQSETDFSLECASTPLQQQVTTEEIARTIRFILDAPSLTGQMIAVDAGQHLGPVQRS
jgi:NAD(P)-dependent dehydrogenase (short-subunit alcohol dehydrogenase family)